MTRMRWRDYQTSSGRRPVRDFLQSLSDEDAAEVVAAMAEAREVGFRRPGSSEAIYGKCVPTGIA